MQYDKRKITAVLLIALMLLLTTFSIQAGSGGQYAINWYSMDSGGTLSATGGAYELRGTIGQVDTALISQDTFDIQAGFWSVASGAGAGQNQIYLPFITKP